jgi:hypothetical protein
MVFEKFEKKALAEFVASAFVLFSFNSHAPNPLINGPDKRKDLLRQKEFTGSPGELLGKPENDL